MCVCSLKTGKINGYKDDHKIYYVIGQLDHAIFFETHEDSRVFYQLTLMQITFPI